MIKIIVDSKKLKQQLLEESEYIHDFVEFTGLFKNKVISLNSNKANTLMHLYVKPDLIEVVPSKYEKHIEYLLEEKYKIKYIKDDSAERVKYKIQYNEETFVIITLLEDIEMFVSSVFLGKERTYSLTTEDEIANFEKFIKALNNYEENYNAIHKKQS